MRIRATLHRYPPALLMLFGLISFGYGVFLLVQGWINAAVRIASARPRMSLHKQPTTIGSSLERRRPEDVR